MYNADYLPQRRFKAQKYIYTSRNVLLHKQKNLSDQG